MPYAIRQRKSKWVVVNKDTGKVKGTHDSYKSALKQMWLLQGVERKGWRPTGAKSKLKKKTYKRK